MAIFPSSFSAVEKNNGDVYKSFPRVINFLLFLNFCPLFLCTILNTIFALSFHLKCEYNNPEMENQVDETEEERMQQVFMSHRDAINNETLLSLMLYQKDETKDFFPLESTPRSLFLISKQSKSLTSNDKFILCG